MPRLFGVDIAGEVRKATRGQLVAGTLTKRTPGTRTPGSLTGGTNPATTSHAFEGFTDTRTEGNRRGSLVSKLGEVVSIIGGSLPSGVEPEVGDAVSISGRTYEVLEVGTDPASALYECAVEGS